MKKTFAAGILLALLLTLPAGAADTAIVPISAPVPHSGYAIEVNGKAVDAQAAVLVPVRAVGEALGFTVTWEKALGGARLDNGQVHTEVIPGRDLFVVTSSKAIGMTAPFSLGVAPVILGGTLYVPVGLFRPLLGNRAEAVTVTDGVVSITAAPESGVQLPNPITTHHTMEALEKAVGFAVPTPPINMAPTAIRDIGGKLAELAYADFTYRVSRGTGDNSGDYTAYKTFSTLTVNGTAISCRGEGESVHVATWTKGDFSFSLCSESGLKDLKLLVQGLA